MSDKSNLIAKTSHSTHLPHPTNPSTLTATSSWQDELSSMITEPKVLFEKLQLDKRYLKAAEAASKIFPLKVTQSYLNRIKIKTLDDPLLQQVLPLAQEFNPEDSAFKLSGQQEYRDDPLNESAFNPITGLIHKYHGRVLLIGSGQCAINCRYCFRRHFDYAANQPARQEWQNALNYILKNKDIDEVILSGGDPLVINDKYLSWLTQKIADIPHVQRLRIHSRLPVVLPRRITPELIDQLKNLRLDIVVVIHSNHAQEIDDKVATALTQLRNANITLLNQTVLLKGINNHSSTLIALNKKLFHYGVLPYYLHLLDKVTGAAHFDIERDAAIELHEELLEKLPGYLVPKLVQEIPSERSKTPVHRSTL